MENPTLNPKPSVKDLGFDLLTLTRFQLLSTLLAPFIFFTLYFGFALMGQWILAALCTMSLSFVTYGSTSHDLVHENLKINRRLNRFLLSFIEAICFRSGHAYKLSHLYHHKRYPHEDDVEGAASRMSFMRTILEGVIFQIKIYSWAVSRYKQSKYFKIVVMEGLIIVLLLVLSISTIHYTFILFNYMCLMIAGSWIIPLITSYSVHTPDGIDELNQTRLFRGTFFSVIAFNHLYHLEHHMYPMIPHKNWPKLATRLDSYFKTKGLKAIEVNF
ncbi:MAG: fatty acid desaturase [Marivirga sp.]|nr:fatty acid desaturase [Marivirga sp.]